MKQKLLVISNLKDPYVNQGLERLLMKDCDGYDQILFLWVNDPCIVIGRNQNPWREADISEARARRIPVVRRFSGGGTVYHDAGNLNFSFISGHQAYNEREQFNLILTAMRRFGIELELSGRKDLRLDGRKVSGNAFYLRGNRRVHHGTLLIDADLDAANRLLKASDETHTERFKQQHMIASVPSEIVNLKSAKPELTVSGVANAIVDAFYKANQYAVQIVSVDNIAAKSGEALGELTERFKSWEWIFGETPHFTYESDELGEIDIVSGQASLDRQDFFETRSPLTRKGRPVHVLPALLGVKWESSKTWV